MLRARDWFNQALRDLEHARKSKELKDYEWSCFASQQAVEKALKALYQYLGEEAWGRDLVKLLEDLKREGLQIPEEIIDYAAFLDKHYILSRYPNGFTAGYPGEHYREKDALLCIESGERIVEWVKGIIEEGERGADQAC